MISPVNQAAGVITQSTVVARGAAAGGAAGTAGCARGTDAAGGIETAGGVPGGMAGVSAMRGAGAGAVAAGAPRGALVLRCAAVARALLRPGAASSAVAVSGGGVVGRVCWITGCDVIDGAADGTGGAGAWVGSWMIGCCGAAGCGAALGEAGATTASGTVAVSWAQAGVDPSASTAQMAVAARSGRGDACVMIKSLARAL
jgi:hypothetical protein